MSDLEIWTALPTESTVRTDLLDNINSRVRRLLKDENELTRDPSGTALGFLITVLGGGLGWWIWTLGGAYRWLEILVALVVVIGIFGFFDSATRAQRDERGRRQRRQAGTESGS